ncbi:beta-ketoacyl synthase chain length factor [Simiduia aestuariiviva]|uniref:Beta-ketoacyl synthase-like N-terminal domain-containing protein n=1 Tax=Simiduia aestuariiviva TaxID=1510459 RepID=A0A839URB7_9GAMM|nr:hypothetical protein [Simiduia aestuariiviva]
MIDTAQCEGISLNIQQWNAWLPGVVGPAACAQWAEGALALDLEAKPDVSAVPSMLRRRLNGVGRLVATVLWDMVPQASRVPMVFCSRHGDQARTLQLMAELAADEPLSPAAFSMSVHNAVAGVLSIAKKADGPMTALAAQDHLVSTGLLEAWGQLQQGADEVLVVAYDMPLPDTYEHGVCVEPPFALALRVTLAAGQKIAGNWHSTQEPCPQHEGVEWLRWLASDRRELTLGGESQGWHWLK